MGGFRQGSVEVNGRRLRYSKAGHGAPLVHLQPPGDPCPAPAHDLLARRFHVVLVQSSGAGDALAEAVAAALTTPPADSHDEDQGSWLSSLATPTLLLAGTRTGATSWRRSLAERIPGCHLVFVYDAGSPIGAERPEAFAEVVTDFIDRHEAFVVSRARTVIHP